MSNYRFRATALRVNRNQSGGVTYYLVEDPDSGVQHRLYEMEYEAARLLDGRRSADKVAKQVSKRMSLELNADDVDRFAQQLVALGFVERVG